MNHLGTFLIFAALLFLGAGVSPSAIGGGVDGGGGGTLPSEHISEAAVIRTVQKAKQDLRLFVRYLDWSQKGGGIAHLSQKLFGGPTTLEDILESIDVEVRTDRPCYDAYGKEVDGSIYASKPSTFCLSAFTIAPKLIEERARTEILALVLHELSHFLDASEDEAVEFQKMSVFWLKRSQPETALEMLVSLSERIDRIWRGLRSLGDKISQYDAEMVVKQMATLNDELNNLRPITIASPFSIHNRAESDFLEIQSTRFMLAYWYSIANSKEDPIGYWRRLYEDSFGSAESVSFEEFEKKFHGPYLKNIFGKELLFRIRDRKDLAEQLRSFADYFLDQHQYVFNLAADTSFNRTKGPWTQSAGPNPWEEFIGNYDVMTTECHNEGIQVTAKWNHFSILRSEKDPKTLYLKERFSINGGNVESSHGLYEGAGDISGTAVFIKGTPHSAERVAESGDRWGERWEQRSYTITQKSDRLQMITRTVYRRWDYAGVKESFVECKYGLKKTLD